MARLNWHSQVMHSRSRRSAGSEGRETLDGSASRRWLLLQGRSEIERLGLVLVTLIAQAAACHHDDEQCGYNIGQYCHQLRQEALRRGWKQLRDDGSCCIARSVQQHRQQQAATDIIEDPRKDDRQTHYRDHVLQEGDQDSNEASPGSIVAWDQD